MVLAGHLGAAETAVTRLAAQDRAERGELPVGAPERLPVGAAVGAIRVLPEPGLVAKLNLSTRNKRGRITL